MTNYIFRFSILICFVTFLALSSQAQETDHDRCRYWWARVDSSIRLSQTDEKITETDANRPSNDGFFVETKSVDGTEFFLAVDCLLRLEGKKGNAKFSGATRPTTSQTFGSARIDVAALYYISFLFYSKWDHGSAVALVVKKNSLGEDERINVAYRAYRCWINNVKTMGLAEARRQKLDPLYGTEIAWY